MTELANSKTRAQIRGKVVSCPKAGTPPRRGCCADIWSGLLGRPTIDPKIHDPIASPDSAKPRRHRSVCDAGAPRFLSDGLLDTSRNPEHSSEQPSRMRSGRRAGRRLLGHGLSVGLGVALPGASRPLVPRCRRHDDVNAEGTVWEPRCFAPSTNSTTSR